MPNTEKKPTTPRKPRLPKLIKTAIEAAQNKKALDLVVLDLRGIASFADFFLICSGTSTPQNQAICNEIEKILKDEGKSPNHMEGYPKADWILMDYADLVIHIFSPASRSFYNLEKLWREALRIDIPDA